MKVVFVSNYFNHHQKSFCEEMYQRLNGEFVFIATTVMRKERRALGYTQDDSPKYVLLAYEEKQQMERALAFIDEADVVIVGSAPDEMVSSRIRKGKLTFRYSERPYKKKASLLKKFYHFFHWRNRDFWKKNVYMLCAGAYTASDYASVGMYRNHTYKWGYFPFVYEYDAEKLLYRKKRNTIMWCGRFIDWKHPDDAVAVAGKLKRDGYDFHLNMIGTGAMEDELKRRVADMNLGDNVHFLGSMSPEQVRGYMEEAGIYLFTSDRKEGWGAVLNESMNSGCAIIASHGIGSVPFLIRNGSNGLIYPSGNIENLLTHVKYLLDHPDEQKRLGLQAYHTVASQWNAQIAAERFCALAKRLRAKKEQYPDLYDEGPCSKV